MKYVILRHELPEGDMRQSHWDVMLQAGNILKTWEILDEPQNEQALIASSLPDHRIDYLDYEGPISKNRGHVKRIARGEMRWLEQSEGKMVAHLTSGAFAGKLTITVERDSSPEHQRTILMFQLD